MEAGNEKTIDDGVIYLNCKGKILAGCDLSYNSQDDKDDERGLVICDVDDLSMEVVHAFQENRKPRWS